MFCIFVFYFAYSVFFFFLLFCVLFLLLCCLSPISLPVYRPLPPGGIPVTVNKYHIMTFEIPI